VRKAVSVLEVLSALSLAAGCARSQLPATALPTQMLQSADSLVPTVTPKTRAVDLSSVCPGARGVGTVAPAVSIHSITFLVNGLEQELHGEDALQAAPGDEVEIGEVTICVGSFVGDGGEACVDFAPVDQSGREIVTEHKGTHTVPVVAGFTTISGLGLAWTIDEDWTGISAVLNHWPREETQDAGCGSTRCERDDWVTVSFR
jgi:hypothetical protein